MKISLHCIVRFCALGIIALSTSAQVQSAPLDYGESRLSPKKPQPKSILTYVGMRRRGSTGGWQSIMTVAAGNKKTPAHQLDVKIVLKYSNGAPVVGYVLRDPVITKGGRGPQNNKVLTATVRLARIGSRIVPSNSKGEVFGVFTSGHRTELTEFEVSIIGSSHGRSIGTIHQVWNEIDESKSWPQSSNPTGFIYNEPTLVTSRMALDTAGKIPISQHDIDFSASKVALLQWVAGIGEDANGDGVLDGDYVEKIYERNEYENDIHSKGIDKFIRFSKSRETQPGTYQSQRVIERNSDLLIDSTEPAMSDASAFDE